MQLGQIDISDVLSFLSNNHPHRPLYKQIRNKFSDTGMSILTAGRFCKQTKLQVAHMHTLTHAHKHTHTHANLLSRDGLDRAYLLWQAAPPLRPVLVLYIYRHLLTGMRHPIRHTLNSSADVSPVLSLPLPTNPLPLLPSLCAPTRPLQVSLNGLSESVARRAVLCPLVVLRAQSVARS